MKKNLYPELKDHLNQVLFASWYHTSRRRGIGVEVYEQRRIPGTDVIPLEILPSDRERYIKDGIQPEDIIILWVNDDAFVPITFEHYNRLYEEVFDKSEGENIINDMYDALDSFIKECMVNCGFGS